MEKVRDLIFESEKEDVRKSAIAIVRASIRVVEGAMKRGISYDGYELYDLLLDAPLRASDFEDIKKFDGKVVYWACPFCGEVFEERYVLNIPKHTEEELIGMCPVGHPERF